VGWGGGEEGKRRGCRGVAASCNESHKRKRSHVILNEGPLRASPSVLTEPPPLFGGPPPPLLPSFSLSSLLLPLSLSAFPTHFSLLAFRSACLRFIPPPPSPPPPPPPPPPTLVVLSLGLLPLVYHPLIPPPVPPPPPPLAPLLRERAGTQAARRRVTVCAAAGASGTDLPSTDLPSPPAVPLALLSCHLLLLIRVPAPRYPRARSLSLLYSPLVPPALALYLAVQPALSPSLPYPSPPSLSLSLSLSPSHASSFTIRFVSSYSCYPLPSRFPLALSRPSRSFAATSAPSFRVPSWSFSLGLSFALASSLCPSRVLTTCVLLAIQSTRKGSRTRFGNVLIR